MLCSFGTGNAESGSASRSRGAALVAGVAACLLAASSLAFAITSPEPSAVTLTLGPICIAVNDSFFPPLENSITTMLDLSITEGCCFQPSAFMDSR